MQTASQTIGQRVSTRTGAIKVRGGHSLAERAGDKRANGNYKLDKQDVRPDGSEAWSCTGGREDYKLEVVPSSGGLVVSCSCDDGLYRRRVCAHMLLLSLAQGYGIRAAGRSLFFASALLLNPDAVAAELVARAEAVERAEQVASLPAAPRRVRPGQPCPRCGEATFVESEPSLGASYLACQNREGFCMWSLRVGWDYDLKSWMEVSA